MRVAVYVEGITEAGFVYRLIGEKYQWNWLSFRVECLNLDPQNACDDLRDYGDENAPDFFLIYDSQSDTSVISDIRERFSGHKEHGFDKVVGLRDVFSESYIELYGRNLNQKNIDEFIKDIREPFDELDESGFVSICFAIMETEAWLLAMSETFSKINSKLDSKWLKEKANVDVLKDPQTTYFHPFDCLESIYISVGRTYSKHWREIKEIVFKLTWADFEKLYVSGKCKSFKFFFDTIFN